MKLIALNKQVIARKVIGKIEENKVELYIPDSAKTTNNEAAIESIGPDVTGLKVGDIIIYAPELTRTAQLLGVDYLIINDKDILAKVEG